MGTDTLLNQLRFMEERVIHLHDIDFDGETEEIRDPIFRIANTIAKSIRDIEAELESRE